jgi:hypothetical protein
VAGSGASQRLATFLGERLDRLGIKVPHDAISVDRDAAHGTEATA